MRRRRDDFRDRGRCFRLDWGFQHWMKFHQRPSTSIFDSVQNDRGIQANKQNVKFKGHIIGIGELVREDEPGDANRARFALLTISCKSQVIPPDHSQPQ